MFVPYSSLASLRQHLCCADTERGRRIPACIGAHTRAHGTPDELAIFAFMTKSSRTIHMSLPDARVGAEAALGETDRRKTSFGPGLPVNCKSATCNAEWPTIRRVPTHSPDAQPVLPCSSVEATVSLVWMTNSLDVSMQGWSRLLAIQSWLFLAPVQSNCLPTATPF